MIDSELSESEFMKGLLSETPDEYLEKEAFMAFARGAYGVTKGLLAKAAPKIGDALGSAAGKVIGKGIDTAPSISSAIKSAPGMVADFGRSAINSLPSASTVYGGVKNLPGRVAGRIRDFGKAQLTSLEKGVRVGGKYSNPEAIASRLGTSTEGMQGVLSQLTPGVSKVVSIGDKTVLLTKDSFGNILDMTKPETVSGFGSLVRNSINPSSWSSAWRRATSPSEKMFGVDASNWNSKLGVGLRRGHGFLEDELTTTLPLAMNGMEYYMAGSPEERAEVLTTSIPSSLAAGVVGRLGGGRAGVLPSVAAYMGANTLLNQVPGLTYKRWGGMVESQVNDIAKNYNVHPDIVKKYLEGQNV